MVCIPSPAIAGSNKPVKLIPGPVQAPPGGEAVKLKIASFSHKFWNEPIIGVIVG